MNVYLLSADFNNQILYKIGFTRRNIESRIKDLQTGSAIEIQLVDSFKSKWATKIEKYLHKLHNDKRLKGEWFALNESDIMDFKTKCNLIHNNLEVLNENNCFFNKEI